MLVHLAPRIKMGAGPASDARAACPLTRQPQYHEECAVELVGRLVIDLADNAPHAVVAECNQLVSHDLRPKTKSVEKIEGTQKNRAGEE
jgi:hypothetical protein